MSLFVVDTFGDNELLQKEDEIENNHVLDFVSKSNYEIDKAIKNDNDNDDEESDNSESDEASEKGYGGLPPPSEDISHIINKHLNSESNPFKKKDSKRNFERFSNYFSTKNKSENVENQPNLDEITSADRQKQITDALSKNPEVSRESFELPGKRRLKKLKKAEREKTKGSDWFNMPATEITDEIENDLKILQMRSILNPKHFYKKNDLKVLPKYFQIGTVQHSHLEFYNERNIRKNKKRTIVDEILADSDVNKYTKRKYHEIIEKNQRYNHKKAMKKMKKLKKNK
ncbi:uncharacterized protein LOC129619295 [Condylostylus longicornis]|uniref:uncharacterized protein LOC129619295 n=1 Tax=Condylostylus longicornis TaxID=2530218 RepID=UPI00244DCB5D|nr:uncharacterized protein LOC129619295 [Condylostylus longicornis]